MAVALANKVVVITGASSGIGAATALALAGERTKLVLGARRMDKLEAVAAEVKRRGAECVVQACDVARREDVKQLVQTAISTFGQLDVMLANAGYGFVARVHEMSEKDFDDIFQVNVKGTWYAMQEAAAVMLPRKSGHIIVVSSAVARRALPFGGIYAMTKAAQLSLAEAMRVELRPAGIYVSSVHPVTTTTEFFDVASERSGTKTWGVGKTFTPEYVGRKIMRLMKHPKPELWPSAPSRVGLGLATLMPRLTDRAMAKMLPKRSR